ncbi:MAG TPA: bifunctional adenosylcobinamide kinase/adenosylcobinamide-phosphate guanylyltransferase [Thermodesulfovibrionales bacterium]|nr:bifunctional adenosylcobinamide kinase/adenosylcobinamide-phosphate guanylyltransferase [Thermodesulfovibrionales bacterium]
MAGAKKQTIFIIGGARSGKSFFALKEAAKTKGKKAYIATGEALDEEMSVRIEKHKKQRGTDWDTFEEPLRIAHVIKKIRGKYKAIVIDCLTLWLSNMIHSNLETDSEVENLISSLRSGYRASRIYIVSNEVGMGIVPDNELARRFRDLAGILNREIAEVSDEVYLMTAGIALKIK